MKYDVCFCTTCKAYTVCYGEELPNEHCIRCEKEVPEALVKAVMSNGAKMGMEEAVMDAVGYKLRRYVQEARTLMDYGTSSN